jgi:hypothetical protein
LILLQTEISRAIYISIPPTTHFAVRDGNGEHVTRETRTQLLQKLPELLTRGVQCIERQQRGELGFWEFWGTMYWVKMDLGTVSRLTAGHEDRVELMVDGGEW